MGGNQSNRSLILGAIIVGFAVLYLWAQDNNPSLANQLEELARSAWGFLINIFWVGYGILIDVLQAALRFLQDFLQRL